MPSEIAFLHAVTVLSILIFKISALIAGVIIIKIGASLLEKGIKGEFQFKSKFKKDISLDLIGASPGLFFILVGGFVIAVAIIQDKPFSLSYDQHNTETAPQFPNKKGS